MSIADRALLMMTLAAYAHHLDAGGAPWDFITEEEAYKLTSFLNADPGTKGKAFKHIRTVIERELAKHG